MRISRNRSRKDFGNDKEPRFGFQTEIKFFVVE